MGRKRKEWRIDWECTTDKIPQTMKKTLIEMIGKEETGKLIRAIRCHKFIMLVGPEHSGKSAIREALVAIGYPWVIEDNGPGRIIKTSKTYIDSSIYHELSYLSETLGNPEKRHTQGMDHWQI